MIKAIFVISSIFFVVAVFVVAYLLYFNKRKASFIAEKKSMEEEFEKQLLKSQIEVQETTYSTLSKELHDNVGQLLSSAKILLILTERQLLNPPDTLLTATTTIGKAITEIRSLSKSLDKEWLEQFSFTENLTAEIARINAGDIISAGFFYQAYIPLKSAQQIILFRIVQEAIQNAIKHANPKHIDIEIVEENNKLCIFIRDDGKGFVSKESLTGMGLKNMRHRVNLLGGTIIWESLVDSGTTVHISLPTKNDS